MPLNREHQEQTQFFIYLSLLEKTGVWEAGMPFAVPNGVRVASIRVAKKAVQEGMKAGVPDIIVPVAKGVRHGLAIEMKIPPNRSTKTQKEWQEKLMEGGWQVHECHSAESALLVFIDYCKLTPYQYRILSEVIDDERRKEEELERTKIQNRRQGKKVRR